MAVQEHGPNHSVRVESIRCACLYTWRREWMEGLFYSDGISETRPWDFRVGLWLYFRGEGAHDRDDSAGSLLTTM